MIGILCNGGYLHEAVPLHWVPRTVADVLRLSPSHSWHNLCFFKQEARKRWAKGPPISAPDSERKETLDGITAP